MNDGWRTGCGAKCVPVGSPAQARASTPGSNPLPITVGMPAAVAISAAATFERIPPDPSADVSDEMLSAASSAGSSTVATSRADGSERGSAVNSPAVEVSSSSSDASTSTATCAARKSLSPKEISSVVVVSFSLMTGTIRHSTSLRSVRRALR